MGFKGTTGKWKHTFTPISSISKNGQFTVKAGAVGTPVCLLPMPYGGINTKEKMEANAKLIAAAPEMLKALIATKELIIATPAYDNEQKIFSESVLLIIENAIEKATK